MDGWYWRDWKGACLAWRGLAGLGLAVKRWRFRFGEWRVLGLRFEVCFEKIRLGIEGWLSDRGYANRETRSGRETNYGKCKVLV